MYTISQQQPYGWPSVVQCIKSMAFVDVITLYHTFYMTNTRVFWCIFNACQGSSCEDIFCMMFHNASKENSGGVI